MKIKIEQDISGTGDYRWTLFTGPEKINEYTGFCYTLGECVEKIIQFKTINAMEYSNE